MTNQIKTQDKRSMPKRYASLTVCKKCINYNYVLMIINIYIINII